MIQKRFVFPVLLSLGMVLWGDVVSAAFDYGGAFRLRQEYWEKVVDLETLGKPDRDFFRLRTSLWGKATLGEDLGAYLKLTVGNRHFLNASDEQGVVLYGKSWINNYLLICWSNPGRVVRLASRRK
jgi:hypothetical protein